MKWTVLALMLMSIFLLTMPVHTEPSRAVEQLMNEPASLFDIGMIRLRDVNYREWTPKLLESIREYNLLLSNVSAGSAVYDFDKNRIMIGVYFIGNPNEETCSTILYIYKRIVSRQLDSLRTADSSSRESIKRSIIHF
jgi:hypothetical protein